MLASFTDPKMLASPGIDPKMFGSLDPKTMASMDPKILGFDPKLMGIDPKALAGMDPKLLAGLDPKMFAGLDPKLLAGMDPKMLSGIDPSIAAMYGLAMPQSSSSSSSNGIGIPSSSKGSISSTSSKAKPGTVAAALEEKKKSKGNSNTSSSNTVTIDNEHNDIAPIEEQSTCKKSAECTNENDSSERHEEDMGDEVSSINERDGNEGQQSKDKSESRKGLTSEERVLLREKKRQRLAKEQENVDTKTTSHEKASHPNPFDDDDEKDEEEELGGNEL